MVWDRFVRIFHWLVALGFLLNYWLLEGGDQPHVWVGYGVAALVLARVVWGFCGPDNARFASFWPTFTRVRYCLQHFAAECRQHRGHNAVAGLMVIFLLTGLILTAVSGWMQTLDRFWGEEWVEWLHEMSAWLVMAAVVVHVGAVVLIQWLFKVPLIRAMVVGK